MSLNVSDQYKNNRMAAHVVIICTDIVNFSFYLSAIKNLTSPFFVDSLRDFVDVLDRELDFEALRDVSGGLVAGASEFIANKNSKLSYQRT